MIEPGGKFVIQYNGDKEVEVVALGLRQQKDLANKLKALQIAAADGDLGCFEETEAALRLAVPGVDDSFLDSVDIESALDICGKVLNKAELSEDERKKSE